MTTSCQGSATTTTTTTITNSRSGCKSSSSSSSCFFPVDVLARVFPYLFDDPRSWYNLALTNHQVNNISKSLVGPRKWNDELVNWEANPKDHYVHQVKFSPDGRHIALLLRVYDDKDAVEYRRLVRIVDIDNDNKNKNSNNPSSEQQQQQHPSALVDIPVGRSTPYSGYCGDYFVVVEPRRVIVFSQLDNYRIPIQEIPTVNRIVGMQVYDNKNPKIAIQTVEGEGNNNHPQQQQRLQQRCNLLVWTLGRNGGGRFVREINYHGSANFCISEDDRVFACVDGGEDGRSITTIFFDDDDDSNNRRSSSCCCNSRTYELDLPANVRRGWIDTCKFSPDGKRLAVLTDEYIFQLDTSVEPPQWMTMTEEGEEGAAVTATADRFHHWRAPDRCTFSGQMSYTADSKYLLAHARTPWNNAVYQQQNPQQQHQDDDNNLNLNTIQIWNTQTLRLHATKGFHDLIGSVSLSPDGKFVMIIQGEDYADVFGSAIGRILIRYIAVLEDHIPYPESGEEGGAC